jgi:hypothetical protein
MNVLIYNVATGAIERLVSGRANVARHLATMPEGYAWKETRLRSPDGWRVVDGEEVADTSVATPTEPAVQKARREAYQKEADPLFFKWQRGEATEQEYLDAVAAIRARFPYAD